MEKYELLYEPIYVSRGDTPAFGERFIGFGYDRSSQVIRSEIFAESDKCGLYLDQVYEMWVSGYRFLLLNNVFTSHWGFQKSSSRPSWRLKQTGLNSLKFDKFRQEVGWYFNVFKLYRVSTSDIRPI